MDKLANGQVDKWTDGQMGKFVDLQICPFADLPIRAFADLRICKFAYLLICAFAALLILLGGTLAPAQAQTGITVLLNEHEYLFRENITFYLEARSANEIDAVTFHYRIVGANGSTRQHADFVPGTTVEAEFVWDTLRQYLPPGAELEYWWSLADKAGNQQETAATVMEYDDNTRDWQEIRSDELTLQWYKGNRRFGQKLFDYGTTALARLKADTGAALDRPGKVYIYSNHDDLMDALSVASRDWTGGVAYPKYGVVLARVQPHELKWGKEVVAHELTHLVIHRLTDNPFGRLPLWLDEGLAMYVMTEGRGPQDEYARVLKRAIENDELLSIRSLSGQFSADDELATLSYAQSQSMVRFILAEYGEERMDALLEVFSRGAHYDDALVEALGIDTDKLEAQWRIYVGAPARRDLPPVPTPQARPAKQIPESDRAFRIILFPYCCGGLTLWVLLVALLYLLQIQT